MTVPLRTSVADCCWSEGLGFIFSEKGIRMSECVVVVVGIHTHTLSCRELETKICNSSGRIGSNPPPSPPYSKKKKRRKQIRNVSLFFLYFFCNNHGVCVYRVHCCRFAGTILFFFKLLFLRSLSSGIDVWRGGLGLCTGE